MEITKGALGLVAAVGIVAGAAGSFVASHAGAPAQGAESPIEAAEPVAQPVAPPQTVATDLLATARPRDAEPPVVERRPVPVGAPRARASVRPPAPAPAPPAVAPTDAPAPQTAPVAPVQPPLADREPDVVAAVEEPRYEDLLLPAQSVIGIQVERTVSSETAQVEDEVIARVTRDVRVGDRVVIPAGSRATGFVTLVERGGRVKDRARLGLRFTSVTLADGTRVPIVTEAIYREGDSPRNETAAKIGGGAIGGAILGGILGGAKGAAIGGSIGAGAGSAAVYAGGRNAATLPAGSPITVRLENPATVTVER
jgi:hypothetical protein